MKNQEKNDSGKKRKNKPLDDYAKYSGIAIKMGLVIGGGVFGGVKLDEVLELNTPVFTLILSLLSVGLAIYIVIRDLTK